MEIYLKSTKTEGLVCKLIKQGEKTICKTVWNRYAYSDFAQEVLFDSSEIETILEHDPIDIVSSRWANHWAAVKSSKGEFETEARKAISNVHTNLF